MPFLTLHLPLRLPRSFTIRKLLVALVWILPAIGAMTLASKPDEIDPKLNGTWKMVSLQYHGETTNFEEKAVRLVIDGSKVNYARENIATISAVASASPSILDWKMISGGKQYEAIYAIEGDKLRICLNSRTEGVKERPNLFSTKDQATWRLLTFQKEASTAENEIEGLTGYVGLALKFDADRKCVEVQSTLEGAPAKKAGLEKGDVVLAIGNERAVELFPTIEMVRKAKPTTKLDIQIRRGEAVKDIQVLVGALPFSYIAGLES
jgi:uncharacterized protein (TIGR03067 family)